MIFIGPIELVQAELDKYIKAKKKSKEAYEANKISSSLHSEHVKNLESKIDIYSRALYILKKDLE